MQPPRPPDTGAGRQNPRGVDNPQVQAQQSYPDDVEAGFSDGLPYMNPDSDRLPDSPDADNDQAPRVGGKVKTGLILLLLCALLLFLRFQVLTIKKLNISGISTVPWQTVASAAGLDKRPFFFTLSEEKVRSGINANRYLIYEGMDKVFPSTLNLRVTERKPFAFFTHLGIGYILARDGIILEETNELKDGANLILVNGLAVWSRQTPGTLPASTDPAQAESLVALFSELDLWGFGSQLVSIDIAQSLNITLHTRDAYTINLGDATNLHAKVGTVVSIIAKLRQMDMVGGIIEASKPGEATYRARQ